MELLSVPHVKYPKKGRHDPDCARALADTAAPTSGGRRSPGLLNIQSMSKWFLPIRALGLAALLVACTSSRRPTAVQVPSHTPLLGPAAARLTMVEFGDFQCPACGAAEPTVKQVLATYPNTWSWPS